MERDGERLGLDRPVDAFGRGQRLGIDAEPVILARDLHRAREQVPDGLVRAAVAELELVGPGAQGQGQQLVAEADAEDRDSLGQEFLDCLDRILAGLGIARPVRQEHAVRGV